MAGKKKLSRKSKFEVPVEKAIGEVFSYESNLVKVECGFTSVKDLYYQQVQTLNTSRPLADGLNGTSDNSFGYLRKKSVNNNKSQDEMDAPYMGALGGGASPYSARNRKNSHNDVEREKKVRHELNPSSGNSPQFSTSMPAQFNFLAHGRENTGKFAKEEYSNNIVNTDHAQREAFDQDEPMVPSHTLDTKSRKNSYMEDTTFDLSREHAN